MSHTGLMLNALPTPESRAESLQRELYKRNQEIARLEQELREAKDEANSLRREAASNTRGVQELRTVLSPLYQGLQHIFGQIDEMSVESGTAAPAGMNPRVKAVWDNWKQKLGEGSAKVIDALLLHGEMNTQQIAIATGYHRTTVPTFIFKLNKAGLLNKNGGRFSLKEL